MANSTSGSTPAQVQLAAAFAGQRAEPLCGGRVDQDDALKISCQVRVQRERRPIGEHEATAGLEDIQDPSLSRLGTAAATGDHRIADPETPGGHRPLREAAPPQRVGADRQHGVSGGDEVSQQGDRRPAVRFHDAAIGSDVHRIRRGHRA